MSEPQYLTAQKLQELKDELLQLRSVTMRECAMQIDDAKQQGDLSENAEYHEARDRMAFIQTRIAHIEHTISNAHLIADTPTQTSTVHIGSTVTVTVGGETKQYTIVGTNEAEPSMGKISNGSPLGEAFFGKAVGDDVEVVTPIKKTTYHITAIS